MRTTIDVPEDLFEEARRLGGTRSKTSTVILALKEFVDRKKNRSTPCSPGQGRRRAGFHHDPLCPLIVVLVDTST